MKMKQSWLYVVGLATIGVLVAGLYFLRSKPTTTHPHRGMMVEAIYGLGRVKPRREYEIKVAVVSTADKVYVREGDAVKQGSPLMKLSDSSVFRSPFDGVVTLVSINEGEPSVPNSTLLKVEDLSDKYVEVSLEQQGALRVQKGQPAQVIFESVRSERLDGKVEALFSRNDDFLAHIEVPDLKQNVLPGMTADVAIIVGRHENALLIPISSVNNGYVTVIADRKKLKKQVKIGGIDGQMAEVIEGDLKESDEIIIGKQKAI